MNITATIAGLSALFALLFLVTTPDPPQPVQCPASLWRAIPADYQCKDVGGCVARRSKNGVLTSYRFRKGDLVSTEDGWVVDPDDGWVKVTSNPPKPKPACVDCHNPVPTPPTR